jgi:hypothetical protein
VAVGAACLYPVAGAAVLAFHPRIALTGGAVMMVT